MSYILSFKVVVVKEIILDNFREWRPKKRYSFYEISINRNYIVYHVTGTENIVKAISSKIKIFHNFPKTIQYFYEWL